jgi:hypothetical protein
MSDGALSTLIAHLLALGPVDEIARERARARSRDRESRYYAPLRSWVARNLTAAGRESACDLVIALVARLKRGR